MLAQEHPPVINYSPQTYDADNQNWMLSQSGDKTIYIANNKGLLSFNGEQWKLYPTPNETVMRGVKAVKDKIYTGSYMDFGVWEKDETGVLHYRSITADKQLEMVEDEHIWNILSHKQYVLFQSLDRVYIYDTQSNTIQIVSAQEGKIVRLFLVAGEFFFQARGEGIYLIENGNAALYNSNDIFKEESLINLFKINEQLVGVTATKGFYYLDTNNSAPWSIITNPLLDKINVYSAIKRSNGSIVLGTIENGIIQFSKEGKLEFKIKKGSGLRNNTALALFEDKEQNLWIGLDAGVDCVNRQYPFTQYIDAVGSLGTVYAAATLDGFLYLGTNQGLFYKRENSDTPFIRIEGAEGQVWNLSVIDGTLFCGHNRGTYIINGTRAARISDVEGTWGIKKIPGRTDLLLQGNYNGLHILQKTEGSWQIRNKIGNFVNSSKHFEVADAQTILVSHEYKGVFEINVDSSYEHALSVIKHDNIITWEHSSLSRLGNTIFYANKDGIYTYDATNRAFTIDQNLSAVFTNEIFVTGKLIEDNDKLWAFTKDNIIKITQDKLDGSYGTALISLPSAFRNTVEGYEIFVRFRESEYLLGTSNGYIVVDTGAFPEQEYKISLKEIALNNLGSEEQLIPISESGSFPANTNNITFSYAIPVYDKFTTTKYTYKLEGLYDEWSPFTTDSEISFENLPSGAYTFKVTGQVAKQQALNETSYDFTIARPWYASNLAIVVYAILAILLFIALNWFYKRYYRKQQQLALDRSKKDLELKTLESEKQIIQLNNANLKQDIDARNRELAVSTMNMVNKNKTLNTIKSALLKAENIGDIKSILKIVDSTIENEEDWNFFEKAFNHADKDFFRKVKDLHPSLTANDLKLCVYLRLNMSSKEIAPLLNISSRSVEIKRYRLRKKLEISREINLNDYFINL